MTKIEVINKQNIRHYDLNNRDKSMKIDKITKIDKINE